MITKISEITGQNVDWENLGKRVRKFREEKALNITEIAGKLGIPEGAILGLEFSRNKETRKSINIIWALSHKFNLSLNWLLNGVGKPHDPDPIELIPETLIIQKGAGIRRNNERVKAEEGTYTDETLEFVMAVDKFKRANNIGFPSLTQIYEIFLALGYRKAHPARIAPLGYIIEKQKLSEKLKAINERNEIDTEAEADAETGTGEDQVFLVQNKPVVSESKRRWNEKRREERIRAFMTDPNLSKEEKQRRLKISRKNHMAGMTGCQKKYLMIDPQGREYITDSLISFCNIHGLNPSHMYTIAKGNGPRKTHKKWRSKELPTLADQVVQELKIDGAKT